MVETVKDKYGKVISYIEWSRHNHRGFYDDSGNYIFIREWWVHKKFRHRFVILRRLVKIIWSKIKGKKPEYVYWGRHKYHERMSIWKIKDVMKHGK